MMVVRSVSFKNQEKLEEKETTGEYKNKRQDSLWCVA